jgi:hypothetical protein
MTYREYVKITIGNFGVSDAEIDFILTEADLNPASEVTNSEDRIKIKKAMFISIPRMMAGLQDVSEGGYSVKWNIDGIKAWYSLLAGELGETDLLNTGPTVQDRSYLW